MNQSFPSYLLIFYIFIIFKGLIYRLKDLQINSLFKEINQITT